ncbi:MAG: hypothetical protein HZC36_03695 [Armatimonadetes bacterium]|nr:hypothetical protein [Armatimonadota bacterium]
MKTLRLGWVWESWKWLNRAIWPWLCATVLLLLFGVGELFTWSWFKGLVLSRSDWKQPLTWQELLRLLPYQLPHSALLFAFSWCLSAGLIGMALKQFRGQSIRAEDLFAHLRLFPKLVPPAIGAAIGWWLLSVALWSLAGSRWDSWLAMPFESLASGLFMLTLPLMTDRGLSLRDATQESVRLLGSQYPRAVAFHFWASLVSLLGVFLCWVGAFWSWPILYISIARAYAELVGLRAEAVQEQQSPTSEPSFQV